MAKKERAKKYEDKFVLDTSFDEALKVMLRDPKKAAKKKAKSKK